MSKTILQILPALQSGGVERGTIDIAHAIIQAGGKALVASAGGRLVPQLEKMGATHIILPLKSKSPIGIWRNIKAIEAIIAQHGVDIVHARSRAPAWSAYFAAKRADVRFISTFHGTYGTRGIGKKAYNRVMTKGQPVIAVSEHIKTHVMQHYALDATQIAVIHRGVDMQQFSMQAIHHSHITQQRQKWRIPLEATVVFLPGRITRWKGQSVLLEAMQILAQEMHLYTVIQGDITGREQYAAELRHFCDTHQLERVRLIPQATQNMPVAYASSDIVVCPSTEPEAFGRIPPEAGAMGKPVIATAHGGAQETVRDDITGLLVPSENASALANAILHYAKHPFSAAQQQAARAFIKSYFSLESMQQKTLEIYGF